MAESDVEMEPPANGSGLAYNPDQDPDEKRRVRGDYRQLQARLEGTSGIYRLTTKKFDLFASCSKTGESK
jgi:hypothetical protein